MKFLNLFVITAAVMMASGCKEEKLQCTVTNLTTGEILEEREVSSAAECDALEASWRARLNTP